MNPLTLGTDRIDPAGSILDAGPVCPCHGALDCPDRVTVTIPAAQVADLADLLGTVDEFLRCGNGAADRLADFYAHRGDPHPGFSANNLIDAVSFSATALHRHQEGGRS